jgi:hypothetical protein
MLKVRMRASEDQKLVTCIAYLFGSCFLHLSEGCLLAVLGHMLMDTWWRQVYSLKNPQLHSMSRCSCVPLPPISLWLIITAAAASALL